MLFRATVIDSDGYGIPGVNVVAIDSAQGAVTDVDGMVTISGVVPGEVLEFSHIGFQPFQKVLTEANVYGSLETPIDHEITLSDNTNQIGVAEITAKKSFWKPWMTWLVVVVVLVAIFWYARKTLA